jgi:penicillin V acylase-like amidase (Ntn superfamily)
MNRKTVFLSMAFFAVLFSLSSAQACTTFVIKGNDNHILFGRNFDFPTGLGHIQINQRNVKKTAFIAPPEIPFNWVSKYGSISFNQLGREFPYGGMNESGLVIEQMWLNETVYPKQDHRKGLTELQWIQYQLDNSATVEEVIQSNEYLRVSHTSTATLHFLVADKSGNIAAIEYLEGKMVVHQKQDLPHPVLANCPYNLSVDYKENKDRQTNKAFSSWTENSSGRFAKAAEMIQNYSGRNPVEYAFDILSNVAQNGATQWSIVYDITKSRIHFHTSTHPENVSIDLLNFDFSCNEPWLAADMNQSQNGNLVFKPFNYEDNLELINGVCDNVEFLSQTPQEVRAGLAGCPLKTACNN